VHTPLRYKPPGGHVGVFTQFPSVTVASPVHGDGLTHIPLVNVVPVGHVAGLVQPVAELKVYPGLHCGPLVPELK
jgi:hypothetical protein